MKLSYQWLREWAPVDLDAASAGEMLTLAGLELDGMEAAAPPLDGVVVARILEAAPHPDADRLKVCTVDLGQEESLQIVCGAPNARPGLTVALATIGTRLPGDFKIRKSKIRGVESFGMLCSGTELGLEESPGILELPGTLTPGEAFARALRLDDSVLEIALTPNRGDCFSVRGVARELACLAGVSYAAPYESSPISPALAETRDIHIENGADCSRYAGRVIRGLDRSAPTPLWMAERLRRADLRSINPLVDVTNYVMLELGQPMHAFDLSRLQGAISVRRGRAGESLQLLNEQTVELGPEELVIADEKGPVALAGAMGGLATAVDDETCDVFLESACFSPAAVAGTGRKFKLSSDSLQRFERGVDPQLQEAALERASQLLMAIAGGQAGPVCQNQAQQWQPPTTELSVARVHKLLGYPVPAERMLEILRALECRAELNGDTLQLCPPSHRYDLLTPIDYIEEIARVHGYDHLPGRPRRVSVTLRAPDRSDDSRRLRDELVARGYFEAFSFSFAEAATDAALCEDPARLAVELDNPMANWMTQMRRSLWASLLPVWKHNVARQQERVRLFEIGRQYSRNGERMLENGVIAGIVSGLAQPEQWSAPRRPVDFHDLKSDVLALLGQQASQVVFRAQDTHPALHPGRAARLERDGHTVGHVGQIHPALLKTLDLPHAPLMFSLDLALWSAPARPAPSALTATPSSRRDIAVVVDQTLAVGKLMEHVKFRAGSLLREVRVFDVFTGESLPKGCKSVALGLIFQDFSRTLTDDEVDAAVAAVTSGLEQKFGAQIRG